MSARRCYPSSWLYLDFRASQTSMPFLLAPPARLGFLYQASCSPGSAQEQDLVEHRVHSLSCLLLGIVVEISDLDCCPRCWLLFRPRVLRLARGFSPLQLVLVLLKVSESLISGVAAGRLGCSLQSNSPKPHEMVLCRFGLQSRVMDRCAGRCRSGLRLGR